MCLFLVAFVIIDRTVADPGFVGAVGGGWVGDGINLLFGIMFDENCMDMKKIGLRGVHSSHPLDPPLQRANTKAM